MASKLLNVRLDDARVDKARRLRESGVALSDVVRDAIDARFEALAQSMPRGEARAIVNRILAMHPDPPGQPARGYDVHDAAAARAAARRELRRRS